MNTLKWKDQMHDSSSCRFSIYIYSVGVQEENKGKYIQKSTSQQQQKPPNLMEIINLQI